MESIKKAKLKTRRWLLMATVMLLVLSLGPSAVGADLSGTMINRYVHDLSAGGEYDTSITFDLELEKRMGPADLYLNPILSLDLTDHNLDTEIDEGYLDLYFPAFDLRLGKQKLTWGKADGVVVTNLVNPLDLTEYPSIEFEDKFQAVNAARLDYYFGSDVLEVVWLPEFESVKLEKEMFRNNLVGSFPGMTIDDSEKEVETRFENSELGIKYSSLGSGYDYELTAGYFWDDEPVVHLEERNGNRVIVPRHHRLTMAGGSFSTTVGPFVVRGEGAYLTGKYFNTADLREYPDGTLERDQLKLLGAADYNLGDYLISLQVLEQMILDYEESIKSDEYSEVITLLVSRDFRRNTISTELNLYYDTSTEDLIARPRFSYDYSDQVNFEVGANYALEGGARPDVLYLQAEYLF